VAEIRATGGPKAELMDFRACSKVKGPSVGFADDHEADVPLARRRSAMRWGP